MKCIKCNRTIPEGSLYCNYCGKKQATTRRPDLKIPEPRQTTAGNWYVQLRINGQSKTVTRPTRDECIRDALLYKAGKRAVTRYGTLYDAEDKYIQKRSNMLSPATVAGYRNIQRNRFKGYSNKQLDRIDWQSAVNAEKCSARTLRNAWTFVVSVLKDNNIPVPKITLPAEIKKERPYLDPAQIKTFIEAIRNTDVEIPALLALHSLRRSEILALNWQDVDLVKKEIHVTGAVVYDGSGLVEKPENKTANSRRIVPIMIDNLADALARAHSTGKVVTDSPHTIYKKINRICADNNLPLVGFHGLRHSFASLGAYLNIPEDLIMLIGGWTGRDIVHGVYTHVSEMQRIRDVDRLKDYFAN